MPPIKNKITPTITPIFTGVVCLYKYGLTSQSWHALTRYRRRVWQQLAVWTSPHREISDEAHERVLTQRNAIVAEASTAESRDGVPYFREAPPNAAMRAGLPCVRDGLV